jgi:BirA family biotin operon repressor/biotin-[acetyl-CoA-carboxylase] ligase
MTFRVERFAEIAAERRLGLGHPISFRTVTGSTNDDALTAARVGAPHGALFIAETQTAGRGRRGNRWFGSAGQSVAFTVLLRPSLSAARASGLALVGGLAVRAAAEAWLCAAGRNEPALVKWPNDVVVGGRKLCGILAESQIRGSELVSVALGIGLNLGMDGFPPELAETATSLVSLGIVNPSVEPLVADILSALEPRIAEFLAGGEGTVGELRTHDALLGRRVRVGAEAGIARGINRSGSLLLQNEKGAVLEVVSGHVELL